MRITVDLKCPYCHDRVGDGATVYCAACTTPHHAECFRAHTRCSVFGCGCERIIRGPAVRPTGSWRLTVVGTLLALALLSVTVIAVHVRGPLDPPEPAARAVCLSSFGGRAPDAGEDPLGQAVALGQAVGPDVHIVACGHASDPAPIEVSGRFVQGGHGDYLVVRVSARSPRFDPSAVPAAIATCTTVVVQPASPRVWVDKVYGWDACPEGRSRRVSLGGLGDGEEKKISVRLLWDRPYTLSGTLVRVSWSTVRVEDGERFEGAFWVGVPLGGEESESVPEAAVARDLSARHAQRLLEILALLDAGQVSRARASAEQALSACNCWIPACSSPLGK